MEPAVQIKIESLTFPPETKAALHDIDLTVAQGDFVAITGAVASGKSALLHCITGAIPKFHEGDLRGNVKVMGRDVAEIPLPKMSDYLGYMMQEPQNQVVSVDVYEDVAFGIGNKNVPWEEMDQRVHEILDFVGLSGLEERKTEELSGGQAQRVVLAGVLALDAPILILDQPTAELDPQGRRDLYQHLASLNREKGVTIIMVMDRTEEVLSCANRVLVMDQGTIGHEYTPEAFAAKERDAHKAHSANPTNGGDIVARVNGAGYTYKGGFVGCEPLDLSIGQGEFVSVIGLNGSGKTTLMKMLEGLLTPSVGSVELFGQTVTKKNINELRKRIGFLFQNPDFQIFASTVEEEVAFTLKLRKLPENVIKERVEAALAQSGLLSYMGEHPQKLSRGQRQMLALASVLVGDPDLIIADEPTSGLDEAQSYMIMDALSELVKQGKTVLLVTHDLSMAKQYAHRIVSMYRHEIVLDIPGTEMGNHLDTLERIGLVFEGGLTV